MAPHATAAITQQRQAAASQLVDELVQQRRKLVPRPDEQGETEWRRVIDFVKRHRLLPPGTRVEKRRSASGDLLIQLLDGYHANHREMGPAVPMPTELESLHPVVAALKNDRGRLVMPSSVRHRAVLYLHGLVLEAVRRGHHVAEQPVAGRYRDRVTTYGQRDRPDYSRREGELNISVDGFTATIEIDEKHPEATDERSGRLVVTVHPAYLSRDRQYRWADGVRNRIEHSVASVLAELERRAVEGKREQEQRLAAWQAAIDQATTLATQAHHAAAVTKQVEEWRQAAALRRYADALEQSIHNGEHQDKPTGSARQWLAWVRQYAIAIDPLREMPAMPCFVPSPTDLEPYLDGWSAYEPERRWGRIRRAPLEGRDVFGHVLAQAVHSVKDPN